MPLGQVEFGDPGQQPLANEDRTIWTVFNGEIFNYVELRQELLALGRFQAVDILSPRAFYDRLRG
jgi:asparagine synthetase B (glutamine-hydrolysing)